MSETPPAEAPSIDLMEEPSYDLIGQPWELSSPILMALPLTMRPNQLTVCETCPGAIWYLTVQKLKCFCGPMKFLSWGAQEVPIRGCDAREMKIAEIEAENDGGGGN